MRNLLGIIVTLLCLIFGIPVTSCHPTCRSDEGFALLRFSDSLTVDPTAFNGCAFSSAKTISWNNSSDCCQWDGITCDTLTSHVIGLDLSCSQLSGAIESNSTLFHLHHLRSLSLGDNNFYSSTISPKFGDFLHLSFLNLSNSQFYGRVPRAISKLRHLEVLDLSDSYSLEMPDANSIIENLTALSYLDISFVPINSHFPVSLVNLSSLNFLDLSGCGLHGKFSSDILHLPHLQSFSLEENPNLIMELHSWSSPLIYLNLGVTNFSSGQLPCSINQTTPLRELSIYNSGVHGPIPTWVWNVTYYIELTNNFLTGGLPTSVNINSSFSDLLLYGNMLNGTIPSWPFQLPSLINLLLKNNQFSGSLSEVSGDGSNSLQLIDFSDNKISGPIPRSFFNSLHLTDIDLSYNNFSSNVKLSMFSKFTNLDNLDLSFSSLSVSTEMNSSKLSNKLTYLGLSSCNLSELPYLGDQENLRWLFLENNNIRGELPKWMVNISRAVPDGSLSLNLSHNSLTHGLEYLPWKKLFSVNISSNMLHEPLPVLPQNLQLYALFLSDNRVNGTINPTICNSPDISILDLSNNTLVGEIPDCLCNTDLTVLNLQSNRLNGTIPANFSKCDELSYLDLSDNQLEGVLPKSLLQCQNLNVLHLGNNKLNDTFPSWLDSLPSLEVLNLRYNNFHGPLITSKMANYPFQGLQVIDLSNNNFSGKLPVRYIQNFWAMKNINELSPDGAQYLEENGYHYSYSTELTFNGVDRKYVKIITTMATFDMSKNSFEGEIPDSIGHLLSLRCLNLSHNRLTGHIPPSIGKLSLLDCLDLSSNMLTGHIPEELVSLTFLGFFNVSENLLEGPIPHGNNFDTFSADSYKGNLALCGQPLPTCGGGNTSSGNNTEDHQDSSRDHWSILPEWEIIVMGFGTGVVIGLAWGYYMLSVGKPFWFTKLACKMESAMLDFYDEQFGRRGRRPRTRRN